MVNVGYYTEICIIDLQHFMNNLLKNNLLKNKINTVLIYSLAFFFCLTLISYYLATNGKINNFPNYFSLIFLAVYGIFNSNRTILTTKPNLSSPLAITVLFLLYISLTTLWSPDVSLSIFLLYIGYSILLLSFMLSYLICHEHLPLFKVWILPLIVLSTTVSACYSIYFFYGIEDYHPLDEDRLYALGRLRNPVVGAFSYGITAVIAGNYVRSQTSLTDKFFWALCLLIIIIAISLTGTRGVWVGLAAVVVAYIAILPKLNLGRKLMMAGSFLLLAGTVLAVIYLLGGETFISHRSLSFRPEIWLASVQKVYAYNLWFGLGINANSELTHGHLTFQHSHSIYFATLFYGGILGFLLLAGLIVTALKHLYRVANSPEKDLALGAFIFAITAFAIDGDRLLEKIDFHWIAFWLPLTLVITLGKRSSKESESF